jgi:hypothetical protein
MNQCFGVGQCALLLESACSSWGTHLFMNLWFTWLTLFFGVVPGGVFSKGACPRGSDTSSKIPRTWQSLSDTSSLQHVSGTETFALGGD